MPFRDSNRRFNERWSYLSKIIDIMITVRSVDGTFYYSMEYLDGLNPDQLVAYDGHQNPSRRFTCSNKCAVRSTKSTWPGELHRALSWPISSFAVEVVCLIS